MNWVGGSKNRVMLKSDTRKQREFFEKKKMQEKIKNLGLPAGTMAAAPGSMDLVTLFIVNQIAAKKEKKNNHKVTHLSQEKGAWRSTNEDPLELPMSPCSPSRLSLVESQPQYSVQTLGLRKRKHHLSELHNNRQLSPVLESNFSDGSASDYRHVLSDTYSPFSSATSGSSSGRFPAGQRGEPFSQPREVRECDPWLTRSHGSQLQVQNPPVSRVNIDSEESSSFGTQKSRGHSLQATGCFLSPPDKEEQETALMGLVSGEYSGQATTFDNSKFKINVQEEIPQTSMLIRDINESQSRHQEDDFMSQHVDSAACGGHGQGSVMSSGSLGSSPSGGLFSSGSDNGEAEYCRCVQRSKADLYCEDTPCIPISAALSCGRGHYIALLSTQVTRATGDCGRQPDRSNRAEGWVESRVGEEDQFVPSHLQLGTTRSQKARTEQEKRLYETRETGTQTDSVSLCHTSDASTQCSLGQEDDICTSPSFTSQSYSYPVWQERPNQATRGQRAPADGPLEVGSHAGTPDSLRENKLLPWNKSGVALQQNHMDILRGEHLLSGEPKHLCRPETQARAQRPTTPALMCIYSNNTQEARDGLRKEQMEGRQMQVKQVEIYDRLTQCPVENTCGEEGKDPRAECSVTNRVSEETETLQEIADILLMMKRENK